MSRQRASGRLTKKIAGSEHGDEAQRDEGERRHVVQPRVDDDEVRSPDDRDRDRGEGVARRHGPHVGPDNREVPANNDASHDVASLHDRSGGAAVAPGGPVARLGRRGGGGRCGFTPSAVSQQIKKLERQTGSAVLERYGRGVLLTDHGERLADQGADLLDRMEQIESDLYSAGSVVGGRLRLAAFSTAVRGLVAPALSLVAADGYDLRLSLVELDPPLGMEAVASGQVDAALVHQWGDTPLAHPEHVELATIGVDVADILVPFGHRARSAVLGHPGGPRRRGVRVGARSGASATSG